MARLAGLEPTASSSAGMRSIQLSYKRVSPKLPSMVVDLVGPELLRYSLVPKEGLEPTRPFRALHPECSASTNSATSACSSMFAHLLRSSFTRLVGGRGVEPRTSCV